MFRMRRCGLAYHIEVLRQRNIRKKEARQNCNGNYARVAAQTAAFARICVHDAVPVMCSRCFVARRPVMCRVRFVMRRSRRRHADVRLGATMRL